MSSVDILSFVATAVILGLAYIVVCTLNGFLQTWLIDKLGDPTSKKLGYLTLNPEIHIDLIGFLFCIFFVIGWHMPVPINGQEIKGFLRWPRVVAAYLASTVCALMIALVTLVSSIALFGYSATYRFLSIALKTQTLDLEHIVHVFEGYSSLVLLIGLLVASSIVLNLYIAVLNFIYNMVRFVLFIGTEKSYAYADHSENILTYGSLIALFIFREFFAQLFFMIIVRAAYYVTYFLGIVS